MKILFVHQGGLGQFVHLARALEKDSKNQVVFITKDNAPPIPLAQIARYSIADDQQSAGHRYLNVMAREVLHGQGAANAARKIKKVGFNPDIICVHPGWGEALFLRDVFPRAKILAYCEHYYSKSTAGSGFSPSYKDSFDLDCRIRMRNATTLLSLDTADLGICPTTWQWSGFPEFLRDRIAVIHDGIDTDVFKPDPSVEVKLPDGLTLTHEDEVVTFVSRNLEPQRGFDIFMRCIESIQARRPNARFVLVGGDERGYGDLPARGGTWRDLLLEKVNINTDRVHFLG